MRKTSFNEAGTPICEIRFKCYRNFFKIEIVLIGINSKHFAKVSKYKNFLLNCRIFLDFGIFFIKFAHFSTSFVRTFHLANLLKIFIINLSNATNLPQFVSVNLTSLFKLGSFYLKSVFLRASSSTKKLQTL